MPVLLGVSVALALVGIETPLVAQPLLAVCFAPVRKQTTPHRQECLCYQNPLSGQTETLPGHALPPEATGIKANDILCRAQTTPAEVNDTCLQSPTRPQPT